MLESKKHVFWEALIVVMVIFVLGFVIGISYESSNLSKVNDFYLSSEIAMSDGLALITLMQSDEYDCDLLRSTHIQLADDVYEQAAVLGEFESAGVLTDSMRLVHKKFDVLRTFIWLNLLRTNEVCPFDRDSIIYLYEYNTEETVKKARQNVISKILGELKEERGNDFILIPIGVDQNISSLNLVVSNYEISSYPAIIINNKDILTEVTSVSQVKSYLD
ncbi:MAG: hypothetical protein ACI83O_000430 [Patescibacteria group bacterium]|jgi:hypothetical protein